MSFTFISTSSYVLAFGRYDARCVSALIRLVTLTRRINADTIDRLTLKLVCKSQLRWGTFLPNLGTLDHWVLELFAMYSTDAQTDGRTKATLTAPFPTGGDMRTLLVLLLQMPSMQKTKQLQYTVDRSTAIQVVVRGASVDELLSQFHRVDLRHVRHDRNLVHEPTSYNHNTLFTSVAWYYNFCKQTRWNNSSFVVI